MAKIRNTKNIIGMLIFHEHCVKILLDLHTALTPNALLSIFHYLKGESSLPGKSRKTLVAPAKEIAGIAFVTSGMVGAVLSIRKAD